MLTSSLEQLWGVFANVFGNIDEEVIVFEEGIVQNIGGRFNSDTSLCMR